MAELPLLLPDWPASVNVRAAVTTRLGGVSAGPYASLNLGVHVGDEPAAVAENRRRLTAALGLAAQPQWLDQVHGCDIVQAVADGAVRTADAAWSDAPGVGCVVMTADCLPVLFCNQAGTEVAAAHAGWRGLAGGVLEAAVARFSCPTDEIMAWLGPAIGPAHFEVGPEVREAFLAGPGRVDVLAACFVPGQGDRLLGDLYELARERLRAAGVSRVYGGGLCTYSDATRFYSFRREPVTGRMASVVWLV